MPFPFFIVGTKYDLYEKMGSDEKKWMTRTLRYFSHINEGSLFYSSTKNMQIGAELRNLFLDICKKEA
jgi:GTPase SAR1 family protein